MASRRLAVCALLFLLVIFASAAVTLVDLAHQVKGVLPQANGGTGDSTGNPTFTTVTTNGASAGAIDLKQGSSNSTATTSITHQAPTSVTSYVTTEPGAAPTLNNSIKLFSNAAPAVESWGNAVQSSILTADATGSTSNTLGNTGMSFSLDASTNYVLTCDVYFTVSSTAGSTGLTLGVNGPGTPTQVTLHMRNSITQTGVRGEWSQGASWQAKLGATASTYNTNPSNAQLTGLIENGTTTGTLNVQFANIGATGTTTVKRGSHCLLKAN